MAGRIKEGEKLIKMAMSGCPDSAHPSQTLGDVHISFENIGEVTDYERSLDLENALYESHFTAGGITYGREMFFSKPADALVIKFTADRPGSLTFSALLRRWKFFDGIRKMGEKQNPDLKVKEIVCMWFKNGQSKFQPLPRVADYQIDDLINAYLADGHNPIRSGI